MSGITPNNTTKQIINNAIVKKLNNLETEVKTLEEGVISVQDDISDVQNDIQNIQGNIETIQGNISDLNGSVTDINAALEGKQSTLTFDNEPRTGSNNPVKSGGIYDALETKLDKESVKFDPEPNGTDALSTGGAYDIVQDLAEQIHNVQNGVVLQSTDETQFVNNGGIIIDNTQEEVTNAIEVRNGDTKLKDTDVNGDLTSTTLAVENDATIGGNATVDGNVTSNEFVGGLEKSISITDENNTTHTFNNTDNVSVSGVLKAQKDINGDSIDSTYVKNATKGVANGIATLDENGRLPYSQLPESAMELKGLWDASTNTPTLVQGVGTNGDFYIVSVGGTQFGESFNVNDRIVFVSDDNTWHRLPYTITSPVTSVNNKIGAVTLYGTDIKKSNSDSETITHALDDILNKISDAIGSLDASSVGGSGKYISEISETDGIITATSEDIDTVVTSGSSKPVTSGGVANILSNLPTDAVLHYSFDEVPDYPDGAAVYKKNNDFTDTTGWSGNATASVSNGKITLSGLSDTRKAYDIQMSAGLIICVKGVANKSANLYLTVRHQGATSDTTLKNFNVESGKPFEIYGIIDAQSIYFNFYCASSEWNITISQIYIGDGSYSTPVIDNANGQNNATNNGAIAVQGVSGKGAYFLNEKYVDCGTDFQFSENFSCSIWCKPEDFSNNCQIVRKQGVLTLVIVSGDLKAYLYDSDGNALLDFFSLSNLPINQFTHIVVVRNGLSFKYYKNGVLIKTASLANTTINKSDNILSIGSSLTEVTHIEDDLLIFDRALTETEIKALYYNKANTPKYYNLNNFKLDLIPLPPSTDGTFQLTATVSNGSVSYLWV